MYDVDKECENLTYRIQELCDINNMSQFILAKESGMSRSTINAIFRGKTMPELYTLLRICNVFRVHVEDMFMGDDPRENGEIDPAELEVPKAKFHPNSVLARNLPVNVSPEEREMLLNYRRLTEKKRTLVRDYMETLK